MAKANMVSASDKEWQAEDDLRTLLRAEEIREDSKRMAAVRKCAREQLADIAKITVLPDSKPEPGDKD